MPIFLLQFFKSIRNSRLAMFESYRIFSLLYQISNMSVRLTLRTVLMLTVNFILFDMVR